LSYYMCIYRLSLRTVLVFKNTRTTVRTNELRRQIAFDRDLPVQEREREAPRGERRERERERRRERGERETPRERKCREREREDTRLRERESGIPEHMYTEKDRHMHMKTIKRTEL
jgi:hypothetical protein